MVRLRKPRSAVEPTTAILLLIVGIVIVVAVWFFTQRFLGTGDNVNVQAILINNRQTSGGQVVAATIRLVPQTNKLLNITDMVITITRGDGSIAVFRATAPAAPGAWPAPAPVSGNTGGFSNWQINGPVSLAPGQTIEITVAYTAASPLAISMSFTINFRDQAGNPLSFSSNVVNIQ